MQVLLCCLLFISLVVFARADGGPNCDGPYVEVDIDAAKRNATIICAIEKLDRNYDRMIDEIEYNIYVDDVLSWWKSPLAPSWEKVQGMCDCNMDGKISASEMTMATSTCIETDFWINRVNSEVC